MAATNRHRRGARCLGTLSDDDLLGDGDFTNLCDDPMKDDRAPIISISLSFNQETFIETYICVDIMTEE